MPTAALAVDAVSGGGLRLSRRMDRPRISLCMIVRDNERTLPACLESIRPWVDEMVIVDTGSVDDTPRIVESFGGRLFHFPWCDDFSAARNESVKHALGGWVFWMDSDDTIPLECGRSLRALAYRDIPPHILGFTMQVHCPGYGDDGEPDFDVTMVDHVKLFRNRPDLRFDHRIHEQVLPAIRAASGEVAWSDLYVVHSGSDQSPAGRAKKLERDLRILHLELSERPEHPFTLFNLGMTYCHASRYAEAADYLERGIARSGAGEPHLRKEFALLMYAWLRLGRHELAMDACRRGRSLFPDDPELQFREAVMLQDLGRLAEARRAYFEVLNHHGEERHFSSVDRALTGYKTRQNLAVLALEMGDLADAEQHWREVVRAVPFYRQGWRGLSETLLRAGRFVELDSVAESLSSVAELRLEGLLIKSRTAKAQGALPAARDALDRALAERPDDWTMLCERSRFLFDHGTTDEADAALRALLDRRPDDAAAHHNRGIVLMKALRYDEAVEAYRQSLRYRPNYAGTCLNLGYALRDSGRVGEAVAAWEQAERLAPGDRAREELGRLGCDTARKTRS